MASKPRLQINTETGEFIFYCAGEKDYDAKLALVAALTWAQQPMTTFLQVVQVRGRLIIVGKDDGPDQPVP